MQSLRTILITVSLAFLMIDCAWAATDNTLQPVPPSGEAPESAISMNDLESKIVEAFTANDCARINAIASQNYYPKFRPLVLAVVAYCKPNRTEAEKLFNDAQNRSPSDDLILVLHARYIFGIDPELAKPLWGKIYVVARNPGIKRMAQDYLEGTQTPDEGFSLNKKWTFLGSLEGSAGHESNPTGSALSQGVHPDSDAVNSVFFGDLTRAFTSGNSLGLNLAATTNTYFSAHSADFWENDVDIPFTLQVGTNEDMLIHPIGRYSEYGGATYESMAGFALTGVTYETSYKQSVQTSIFVNHYFIDVVGPEGGTHFRFEYNWEFYPENYYIHFLAFIEHTSAGDDTLTFPASDIPYSNNQLGTSVNLDYRFHGFTLSFNPSFTFRIDDNPSIYQVTDFFGNTSITSKLRQDKMIDLKARVSFPISRNLEVIAFYDYNRVYSNIGVEDYFDRNYQDQTVGIGFRTFVTNY
jgi:hypothetical protein